MIHLLTNGASIHVYCVDSCLLRLICIDKTVRLTVRSGAGTHWSMQYRVLLTGGGRSATWVVAVVRLCMDQLTVEEGWGGEGSAAYQYALAVFRCYTLYIILVQST